MASKILVFRINFELKAIHKITLDTSVSPVSHRRMCSVYFSGRQANNADKVNQHISFHLTDNLLCVRHKKGRKNNCQPDTKVCAI